MCDTFTACFQKLERLSTQDLDRSVAELVQAENHNVAMIIAHLAEISRRKADLASGYRNLFDYCVRTRVRWMSCVHGITSCSPRRSSARSTCAG